MKPLNSFFDFPINIIPLHSFDKVDIYFIIIPQAKTNIDQERNRYFIKNRNTEDCKVH